MNSIVVSLSNLCLFSRSSNVVAGDFVAFEVGFGPCKMLSGVMLVKTPSFR